MKGLVLAVVLAFVFSAAGVWADSPGPPAPTGYTLLDLYNYLDSGIEATEGGHSLDPPSGSTPGDSQLKSITDVYVDTKAEFDQCDTLPEHVAQGQKFFSVESGSWGVHVGTASGGGGLLKTGQQTSCRTGDDGYYEKGADFDYTDNGNGTITDNFTGLMWPKDADGAGCKGGSYINWTSAIDWAESLIFAGHSDWRLPNFKELNSIFITVPSNADIRPMINTTYFINTPHASYFSKYWSSTAQSWTGCGWHNIINFSGYEAYANEGNGADINVRAVRDAG